jgi:hypothetical protein
VSLSHQHDPQLTLEQSSSGSAGPAVPVGVTAPARYRSRVTEVIGVRARVSFSRPGRGVILGRPDGSFCRPGEDSWASFDVRVYAELGDGGCVGPADPIGSIGRPLEGARAHIHQHVRGLVFPPDPDKGPPKRFPGEHDHPLVTLLQGEGVETDAERLAELPFNIELEDEVAARLEPPSAG